MKGKTLLILATSLFLTSGCLVACGKKNDPVVVDDKVVSVTLDKTSLELSFGDTATLVATVEVTGNPDKTVTWASSNADVATVDGGLVTAVGTGSATITARAGDKSASCTVSVEAILATGAFSYVNYSNEDRTEILGALEKWAVDKKLTGITLFEDGGYVMYSPLVEKGAPAYIKGFGFGTLPEGRLLGPLTGEEEAKYQMYYHTYDSSDPAKILYMDDDGGVVSGLVGYVSGGYYDIIMDETRTGYEWVGDLARNDAPIAVDPAEDGSSKVYRIPVKTGADLKYSTLTQNVTLSAFNNREVALEDYITPYKVYYTAAYGMRRNSEIKDSNSGSIKGSDAYLAASKEGFNQEAWNNLGIKSGHDDEIGDYLEFTFNTAYTPFWARYYLSSSMFAPVPQAFIEALGNGDFVEGLKLWGKFDNGLTMSPVDTFLSTGPYVLEEWKNDSKIVFKRNPNYVYGTDRKTTRPSHYYIEGVYNAILKSLNEDREAALKEFLADKLHACSIPSTQIENYYDDPRTTLVPGATTTKLNLNTCDEETWVSLFGEDGSITRTPKASYWPLKPAMHNTSFVDGLSYAINRKAFAASLGATPSNDYFGSSYYADPEEGIFYNDTDAHKRAVAESLEGTDGFGYSLEKAKAAFATAVEELIADGSYEINDTIEIEMAWMVPNQGDTYAKPLAKMIEDAFNESQDQLTLKINHYFGAVYTDVYYKKMMVGQFDIGYGGVEGNPYNPLNFLEVLKSDNSSTFTLNWGIDTNEFAEIEWDGRLWTFDALWEVADHGGFVQGGKNVPTFDFQLDYIYDEVAEEYYANIVRNADGSLTITGWMFTIEHKDEDGNYDFYTTPAGICFYAKTSTVPYTELYAYSDGTTDLTEYDEEGNPLEGSDACIWTFGEEADEDGYVQVTITLSAAFMDAWLAVFPQDSQFSYQGIDVYKFIFLLGDTSAAFHATIYEGLFPGIPND